MSAPMWLVLIVSTAALVVGFINLWKLDHIMSEEDDLNAGVQAELAADADIMAELSKISGELTQEAQALKAALASGDSTAINAAAAAAAQTLTANAAKVEAAVAAAKSVDQLNPPPPPPPEPPITVDVSQVPATATVAQPYTGSIAAAGGAGTLTLTVQGLPDGLSMNAGGAISGAPGTVGEFSAVFTAHDASNDTGTATVAISVAAAAPGP